MKLFRIHDIKTGGILKFNSIQEIDRLVDPSFNAQELKRFYNNEDATFRIATYTPHTMKRAATLNDDALIDLLERYEAADYEILAEEGTQYDTYTITNHKKDFEYNNERYTYLFILPDYDNNERAVYLSNEVDHYEMLKPIMTDGAQMKRSR